MAFQFQRGVEPDDEEGNDVIAAPNPAESEPIFEIEVFDVDAPESDVSDDEEENGEEKVDEQDEEVEEEEVLAPIPKGRSRKPNTMTGSVKRGKYSR